MTYNDPEWRNRGSDYASYWTFGLGVMMVALIVGAVLLSPTGERTASNDTPATGTAPLNPAPAALPSQGPSGG